MKYPTKTRALSKVLFHRLRPTLLAAMLLCHAALASTFLLNENATVITKIRVDPQTKDIVLTIKDRPGTSSYNVYFASALSYPGGISPFILAQTNVLVSGTGATEWRDNGTRTGKPPMAIGQFSRFYEIEVNTTNQSPTIYHLTNVWDIWIDYPPITVHSLAFCPDGLQVSDQGFTLYQPLLDEVKQTIDGACYGIFEDVYTHPTLGKEHILEELSGSIRDGKHVTFTFSHKYEYDVASSIYTWTGAFTGELTNNIITGQVVGSIHNEFSPGCQIDQTGSFTAPFTVTITEK